MKSKKILREKIKDILTEDYLGQPMYKEKHLDKILTLISKEIKKNRPKKAEKAMVLNGKLKVSYDPHSTLYNDYSTKLAYNQALKEHDKIITDTLK